MVDLGQLDAITQRMTTTLLTSAQKLFLFDYYQQCGCSISFKNTLNLFVFCPDIVRFIEVSPDYVEHACVAWITKVLSIMNTNNLPVESRLVAYTYHYNYDEYVFFLPGDTESKKTIRVDQGELQTSSYNRQVLGMFEHAKIPLHVPLCLYTSLQEGKIHLPLYAQNDFYVHTPSPILGAQRCYRILSSHNISVLSVVFSRPNRPLLCDKLYITIDDDKVLEILVTGMEYFLIPVIPKTTANFAVGAKLEGSAFVDQSEFLKWKVDVDFRSVFDWYHFGVQQKKKWVDTSQELVNISSDHTQLRNQLHQNISLYTPQSVLRSVSSLACRPDLHVIFDCPSGSGATQYLHTDLAFLKDTTAVSSDRFEIMKDWQRALVSNNLSVSLLAYVLSEKIAMTDSEVQLRLKWVLRVMYPTKKTLSFDLVSLHYPTYGHLRSDAIWSRLHQKHTDSGKPIIAYCHVVTPNHSTVVFFFHNNKIHKIQLDYGYPCPFPIETPSQESHEVKTGNNDKLLKTDSFDHIVMVMAYLVHQCLHQSNVLVSDVIRTMPSNPKKFFHDIWSRQIHGVICPNENQGIYKQIFQSLFAFKTIMSRDIGDPESFMTFSVVSQIITSIFYETGTFILSESERSTIIRIYKLFYPAYTPIDQVIQMIWSDYQWHSITMTTDPWMDMITDIVTRSQIAKMLGKSTFQMDIMWQVALLHNLTLYMKYSE